MKPVLPSNQVSFFLRANSTSINSLSSTGLASDSFWHQRMAGAGLEKESTLSFDDRPRHEAARGFCHQDIP